MPSCSKLTMSSADVSFKLWSLYMANTLLFLLKKMWFAKATHIFFSKSTCEYDIVLTRTVNIVTTNELVKLTILWTSGPWLLSCTPWSYLLYKEQFLPNESQLFPLTADYYTGKKHIIANPPTVENIAIPFKIQCYEVCCTGWRSSGHAIKTMHQSRCNVIFVCEEERLHCLHVLVGLRRCLWN